MLTRFCAPAPHASDETLQYVVSGNWTTDNGTHPAGSDVAILAVIPTGIRSAVVVLNVRVAVAGLLVLLLADLRFAQVTAIASTCEGASIEATAMADAPAPHEVATSSVLFRVRFFLPQCCVRA